MCTLRSHPFGVLAGRMVRKMYKVPLGSTARTGEICPESGVWKVVGSPSTTAPIAKHNRMPPTAVRP
jgi:hypothetical protein